MNLLIVIYVIFMSRSINKQVIIAEYFCVGWYDNQEGFDNCVNVKQFQGYSCALVDNWAGYIHYMM